MIVDTHAHVVPAQMLEALRAEKRLFPSVKVAQDGAATRLGFAGGALTRPVAPRLSDMAQRKIVARGAGDRLPGGGRLARRVRLRTAARGRRRLGALHERDDAGGGARICRR